MTREGTAAGFTLIELLIATAVIGGVAAATLGALAPAHHAFMAGPERADTLQRVRVAADALARDLAMAGAGIHGLHSDSPMAVVLPYRIGQLRSDARGGVYYRPDTITILYVPPPPLTGTIPFVINGGTVLVEQHAYYLKVVGATRTTQLMHYDGLTTDLPVVEDVARVGFDYFGDAAPPQVLPADVGYALPRRATYGPTPPPLLVDDPSDSWAAGENCLFEVVDGDQVARLAALPGSPAAVALPPSMLVDGPWCPDAADAERFDADLFRIRRIRVTMRVQANERFRGAPSRWFMHGGTATSPHRYVPDEEIRFDVSPRNLNRGR